MTFSAIRVGAELSALYVLLRRRQALRELKDEKDLIAKARAGDDDALSALVEVYAPRVLRFGRRLCRTEHDAEDVVQQTLLSLATRIGEFRGDSQLSSWLFAVARSHCIKLRTRGAAARESEAPDESIEQLADPARLVPDEAVSREQLERALDVAMRSLDVGQREVLLLRDVEGLSAAEVAKALGTSTDAVKSRLHRARQALRDRLAPWFEQSTPQPSCPDVVDLLSRYQEGDVTSEVCKTMEAHVEGCSDCAKRCHSLRSVLAACSATPLPELSEELKRAVREQMRRSLRRQIGS
ncbi:MAG: sigma-70 family RNA polymerase sigma factor [Myxococcota bacterium]